MSHPSTSSAHAIPAGSHQQQQSHTIVQMPQQPPVPPPQLRQPNPPSLALLHGSREEYINVVVPLYEAALKGDWKAAKPLLDQHPYVMRCAITANEETPLHIAASAEGTKAVIAFATNLINLMDKQDLQLQNKNLDTPLSLAAAAGNIETAKALVQKNPALIDIPNKSNAMPLYMAVLFGKPDMVRYLYGISNKMSGDFWSRDNRGWVLQKCVESDIFDVAIEIVDDRPELTDNKRLLSAVLLALAEKTDVFEGEKRNGVFRIIKSFFKIWPREKESDQALPLLKIIWAKVARMPKEDIDDILRGPAAKIENENKEKECEKNIFYPFRVLFLATKMGNTRFIIELIRLYPDAIWKLDDKGKTIFHLAIKRREANIYNLLHELGALKYLLIPIEDNKGNNMLHMVGKSTKQARFQNVSGVVSQMQHDLLWFKEVEKMIPHQYRRRKNKDGETPQDLFTKRHVNMVTKGEYWIKDTAVQGMVVATLIATIAFAGAFAFPGGYNQDTGIPFFHKKPSFMIFVISDVLSLISSSSTLVLIFLYIFTSRYAEHDFLQSLPRKLLVGLTSLYFSVLTMMIAFSASFFVLYNKNQKWLPITVTGLASMPVILFAILQFHYLGGVAYSTYQSRYLFKPKKRILYC